MVTGVQEGALLAIDGAVGISQIYAGGARDNAISESGGSKSKHELVDSLRGHAQTQTVLLQTGKPEKGDIEKEAEKLVMNPILTCLQNLYKRGEHPAPYVLYAPPSIGKTTAGRAFLKHSLTTLPESKRPKALMIRETSQLAHGLTYFEHISTVFGSGTTPWLSSLIVALQRSGDEKDKDRLPSVLIMDDFDSAGEDDINIIHMRNLSKDLDDCFWRNEQSQFYLITLTQDRDVANKLCRINNWKKIAPLPGSYIEIEIDERTAEKLPDPNWTLMPWSSRETTAFIKKCVPKIDVSCLSFPITDGMNPTAVQRVVSRDLARRSHDPAVEKFGATFGTVETEGDV